MENCFTGISVPTPIQAPCGGEFTSTECVATPNAMPDLELAAGATQEQINIAIKNALVQKDAQIATIIEDTQSFVDRKIFRGTFSGSVLANVAEDTIGDLAISNTGTGVYELSSNLFTISTSIIVTPNAIAAGNDEVTVTYDYINATSGVIVFKVKNNGILVDLLTSPIKIEI